MELPYLSVPDVHTLVEGAAGQVPPVGAEGHAVDGLLVARERVDADTTLRVPQPYRRVKGRAVGRQGRTPKSVRAIIISRPPYTHFSNNGFREVHLHTDYIEIVNHIIQ